MRYLSVGAFASLIVWIVIIAIIVVIYILCCLIFPSKEVLDTIVESLDTILGTIK